MCCEACTPSHCIVCAACRGEGAERTLNSAVCDSEHRPARVAQLNTLRLRLRLIAPFGREADLRAKPRDKCQPRPEERQQKRLRQRHLKVLYACHATCQLEQACAGAGPVPRKDRRPSDSDAAPSLWFEDLGRIGGAWGRGGKGGEGGEGGGGPVSRAWALHFRGPAQRKGVLGGACCASDESRQRGLRSREHTRAGGGRRLIDAAIMAARDATVRAVLSGAPHGPRRNGAHRRARRAPALHCRRVDSAQQFPTTEASARGAARRDCSHPPARSCMHASCGWHWNGSC